MEQGVGRETLAHVQCIIELVHTACGMYMYMLCPHTVLQVRPWFQNEDPSSKLKSTPPMGAPNAAVEWGR